MRTTPAALPTLGELSFDLFSAAATGPWLFDRLQRSQSFFQNRLRPAKLLVLNPQFGPAIDRREFARRSRKIEIFSDACNAVGAQDISQMANHQRIFGAVNLLHCDSTTIISRAAAPLLLASKLVLTKENVLDDLHNCLRLKDAPARSALRD